MNRVMNYADPRLVHFREADQLAEDTLKETGIDVLPSGENLWRKSYSRILVTEGIRRQRLELAI